MVVHLGAKGPSLWDGSTNASKTCSPSKGKRISTAERMENYRLKLTKSLSEKATRKESRITVGMSTGLSALVSAWVGPVP
ncbi:hypothetical protein LIER_29602 [Lithospermum erythrorhizon]|uniref:Uncharacterized protein n=1 Tax=Lithospermum erythrorhizon TaxID=34254 RepID=A0AAV3RN25_LITER